MNGPNRLSNPVLVLSNEDLTRLMSPMDLIAAVEAAALAMDTPRSIAPMRVHIGWGDKTFLVMPALAEGHFGTKIVSSIPDNTSISLPVISGVYVLCDGETGIPMSIMDASVLTAQRTGAVGALGAKYMTPEDLGTVGIIGCGVQGASQAIFACAVRPIREIFCLPRSAASFERFRDTINYHIPNVKISVCTSATELLKNTDLIVTATTSSEPVLPDDSSLLEHKHFVSIGSFRPTMQELPDSVYRLAGALAIDSEAARREVGDVINPLQKGILRKGDIFSIAELVAGKRRVDTKRTTAYKSVGMALYDLFVAQVFFGAAKRRGLGCEIHL